MMFPCMHKILIDASKRFKTDNAHVALMKGLIRNVWSVKNNEPFYVKYGKTSKKIYNFEVSHLPVILLTGSVGEEIGTSPRITLFSARSVLTKSEKILATNITIPAQIRERLSGVHERQPAHEFSVLVS